MTVCETNGGGKREKYIRESREEDQPSLLAIWIIHVQNYVDIHEYMDVPPNVHVILALTTKDSEEVTTAHQSFIWVKKSRKL